MNPIIPEQQKPGGHYVPAMQSGGTVYISGQLPMDARGVLVDGPIETQAQQALSNLEGVLLAAGLGRGQVLQCRVYIADISLWDRFNQVYAAFFGDHKPARAVVPTGPLHHGALVEIEAIAELEVGV